MRITETQRAVIASHARHQLHCLEACPRADIADLGYGRDLYNRTWRLSETEDITQAVAALDALVKEVYAGTPPTEPR